MIVVSSATSVTPLHVLIVMKALLSLCYLYNDNMEIAMCYRHRMPANVYSIIALKVNLLDTFTTDQSVFE